MKPVTIHAEAETELAEAVAYYESKRSGLGRELRLEIEAAIERIRQNPRAFPAHTKPGTRKCPVGRFPYTLFFVELDDRLWVAAIAHNRRRPEYWRRRQVE